MFLDNTAISTHEWFKFLTKNNEKNIEPSVYRGIFFVKQWKRPLCPEITWALQDPLILSALQASCSVMDDTWYSYLRLVYCKIRKLFVHCVHLVWNIGLPACAKICGVCEELNKWFVFDLRLQCKLNLYVVYFCVTLDTILCKPEMIFCVQSLHRIKLNFSSYVKFI